MRPIPWIKRLSALLLSAALLLLPVGASAEEGAVPVSSAEELAAMAEDPGGNYCLSCDIDMEGVAWIPFAFSGRLDGAGHSIYNLSVRQPGLETGLTVDGNYKGYETCFAGLFSILDGAEIRDLTLLGADVDIVSADSCFVGGLAGCLKDAKLSGCTVIGRIGLTTEGWNVGVGGLAGYGSASLEHCAAEVELRFTDLGQGHRCEQFMGGLIGAGYVWAEDCRVAVQGYDECRGYVHNGGGLGLLFRLNAEQSGGYLRNCDISGSICFFEDNPDRRAYCGAAYGEILIPPSAVEEITGTFTRDERFEYDVPLVPDTCEQPDWTDTRSEGGCTDWSYTEHRCAGCGYSYRLHYAPPAHEAGDWETELDSDGKPTGRELCRCRFCGELMETRAAEAPPELPEDNPAELLQAILDRERLELRLGDRSQLSVTLENGGADAAKPVWSSDDPSVAEVSPDGTVTAVGRGETVIRCTPEGGREAVCTVTVSWSFFGWLKSLFR